MKLSDFGNKMNTVTDIETLMDDMSTTHDPIAMFGGGEPAAISDVNNELLQALDSLISDKQTALTMLGSYDQPQGNTAFIAAIRDFLNRHYNLGITTDNIAITPGSQSGYFLLLNILAGKSGSSQRKILFPLVPEYIGYVDQALEAGEFISNRPAIRKIGDHEFEYSIDFETLPISEDTAAICLSRPTNPTGNVVSDEELQKLGRLAADHDIPLIVDCAYGLPFPDIVIPDIHLLWTDHTVISMSLSKLGLPSLRIGIFVGPADLMRALTRANATVSLASSGFGQYITRPLFENDKILELSEQHIKPYYMERAAVARALIKKHFPQDLPWRLHTYQGSYFFWLWLEESTMTSKALYAYLKQRGVIIVPGEHFFLGQDTESWNHSHECLRISFARPDEELEQGLPIIAEALYAAYRS